MPSNVIRHFTYNASSRKLFVVFQSGRRYAYLDVPDRTFQDMKASFSKGEFFNAHIRDRYEFVRGADTDAGK
jgi:hypothetical protein